MFNFKGMTMEQSGLGIREVRLQTDYKARVCTPCYGLLSGKQTFLTTSIKCTNQSSLGSIQIQNNPGRQTDWGGLQHVYVRYQAEQHSAGSPTRPQLYLRTYTKERTEPLAPPENKPGKDRCKPKKKKIGGGGGLSYWYLRGCRATKGPNKLS